MNYGKAIKKIRSLKKISQVELSEEAKIGKSYLSKIENGESVPALDKLEKISEALDVPFYLMAFLASEKNDLDSLPLKAADEMKKHLFDMVMSIDE